jgi:hypothetical protein
LLAGGPTKDEEKERQAKHRERPERLQKLIEMRLNIWISKRSRSPVVR